MTDSVDCKKQIDELLNLPQQMWLLGAGTSKNAGIPLMHPLTNRVETMLQGEDKKIFQTIRNDLPESAHVEHVLSHIGDLIAIADRGKRKAVEIGGTVRTLNRLDELHRTIQKVIRDTMRWGYIPACDTSPECIGEEGKPIVSIDGHVNFVQALFHGRRAGLERRPPVAFFTTNYDTLLEDALALCRVVASDGFCGGAMAFWDPGNEFERPFNSDGRVQAKVFKLHGSIDWIMSSEDIVVRRREGAGYPDESKGRLLIYPQATKYMVTQRDPFATLFTAFRLALADSQPGLLTVCGYSFRDDHKKEEIDRALKQRGNRQTLLALAHQEDNRLQESDRGLPSTLVKWLSPGSDPWRERIVVAGSHGVYHGSLENKCPCEEEAPHEWWSFQGLTNLIRHGPEVEV